MNDYQKVNICLNAIQLTAARIRQHRARQKFQAFPYPARLAPAIDLRAINHLNVDAAISQLSAE